MALGRKRSKGVVGRLTPANAKNLLGVVKVIGPAVVPVVAPYALKAASTARDGLDRYRARRLGVDIERLAEYTGRGGALHARIVGADQSLAELAERPGASAADQEFAAKGRDTLTKLAAAVRAAERMPTGRRKAAHKSVAGELDPIERELLQRLGL
ncbi:MAG TPA: DUF6474 family protein [Pseudonocardiaceae bacterium]|nr:DUF6474 family protein [Pseudonocardiaceae bacterium]